MSINNSKIKKISCYYLNLDLIKPYKLSYKTFYNFKPFLINIIDDEGREGWGEQHISPGSSFESRELGWNFIHNITSKILNKDLENAKKIILQNAKKSPVASTSIYTAIEMLEENKILKANKNIKSEILTSFNSDNEEEIKEELDQLNELGFKTFKIKVGKSLNDDIKRVETIQKHLNHRGRIRIDANRGYSEKEGCNFVKSLDPFGIELFEQPCDSKNWQANANVAKDSKIPIMLDEPICKLKDIERASKIKGVKFCKLKLKRFHSLQLLEEAIAFAHNKGIKIILGDGLGGSINCWMEAMVANNLIFKAGEYNGLMKIKKQFNYIKNPIKFEKGHLIIEKDWYPKIDKEKLFALTDYHFELG